MSSVTLIKNYDKIPFCENEILRYAGCKNADRQISRLLENCINEIQDKLTYKVCYREFPITVNADFCNFSAFTLRSKKLAHNLQNCEKVIVFAATIGMQIDRLIAKYGHISASKALMLQAIGAERIETLCDTFCKDIEKELGVSLQKRFSPGYSDLPLFVQKDIFAVLDCSRHIGLTLNDSLIMSPSKSVTAFVGLSNKKQSANAVLL